MNEAACVLCGLDGRGETCAGCGALLPLRQDEDYYSILGIPRRAALDPGELKTIFYRRSKELHPDRFMAAAPALRQVAFQRSTFLNDAYNALKDPVRRGTYLVKIETGRDPTAGSDRISARFFDLVFEANQAASALAAGGGSEGAARAKTLALAARAREEMARASASLAEAESACDTAAGDAARAAALATLAGRLGDLVYLGKIEKTLRGALEGLLVA